MAIITFETQNSFLKRVFKDYLSLWENYFKSLNNYLVCLSLILMIITIPFYIIYLLFYSLFLVCSFAQDFENLPQSKIFKIIVLILKIILIFPSYIFIMFTYYLAFTIGGIITIITIPCEKLINHITINKLVNNLLDEDNKGE